jgi:DNA-binding beta-propeller fold protein YncE
MDRKHTTRALAGAGILAATFLLSCSNERPLSQQPEHYNLYAAIQYPGGIGLDVIDTDTDSVLRRFITSDTTSLGGLSASSDGKWLAAFNGGAGIRVYDLNTEMMVGWARGPIVRASFVPGRPRLIGIAPDSVHVYRLPDLSVDTVVSFETMGQCFPSKTTEGEVIATAFLPDHLSGRRREVLLRINTDNWSIVDSFSLESPATGGGMAAVSAALSPDGRRIFLLGADDASPAVFSFDIATHAPLIRTPTEETFGWIQVSPDGREVWVTQSFVTYYHPWPTNLGYVVMIDATSGAPIDTVRTLGLSLEVPQYPLPIRQILFHPAKQKAYVAGWLGRPAILVIDTQTRGIASYIYDKTHNNITDIAIAPN